ncbi:uncharacterized protein IUM83_19816 [Phytophthora cinnamomi]|uniref:uncharacterized protein n=1 Tax=Phytophthora cinnamomi TaxID=4785 RepID=UPI003559F619|nr:hypothetical protein IUM83_19816 [Phytophthora cinnamomi]
MADALLSLVAAGELPSLPRAASAASPSAESLDALLTPFLPLLTRLQTSRRAASIRSASALDATLLRVPRASAFRLYAQVFSSLTPSQLTPPSSPPSEPAFRRFERGSALDRVRLVLGEWLLGARDAGELLATAVYQEDVAAILALALASPELQAQLDVQAVARRALAVPVGPALLARLAANDPTGVEPLLDALVAAVADDNKPMAQQEQEARPLANARRACVQLAALTPLYAARLRDKLSAQSASLHCAAMALQLLTDGMSRQDVAVFLYQWLKRDGAPGSALRTYVQLASREATATTGDFQQEAATSLAKIRAVLLDTLENADLKSSPYELTAALGVCVGLQVLGSFPLTEKERIRLLQSLDKLAQSSTSSRAISLAFIVVVLVWYPLAPALSKSAGTENEHTKAAVALSQQVLVALFHARDAGAGPLFVVSAVLFYTKAPALVPFLASVIGFDGDTCNAASTSAAGCGIQVQQALRAEYLHVFGDVVLKPVLTENLLAREVLTFPPRLRHATMVAGSKLSSLVSTSSVVSGASMSTALGPGADICLHYDLSAFPLRNIVTQALAHGDQGGAFEYVAPTLLKLMMEEHPQLFDAATASVSSGTTLNLLPLSASPRDEAERDLASSWFRRRRKRGELPSVRVIQAPASWTAVQALLLELQSAPIAVVMRELQVLIDGFLPYAVLSSKQSESSRRQVAAFCAQLAALYESRARREQGASISLLMRLVHAFCFPDALWRQQQVQTNQGTLQLLTYMQVLEEPFRVIEDAHDGVFRQPALLRMLLGLVRDVRAAANVHVTKCDPSLVAVEGMAAASSTTASVQQHQLLQDCLLTHGILKRLLPLVSEPSDDEVAEESRTLLCTIVQELLTADAEVSSPPPPRLLLAIHTQGYDAALVPLLVAHVPAMKLLWDHWMAPTASNSSGSSSSRSTTPGTKPLMEFVAEGADKDLPKWRFRLRVVLSLCAKHLSGSKQSAAMQQALRVVWNKLRNGVGSSGENSAGYVNLLGEVLPWIVHACSQNADLSAELVHFLLKLQRQLQSGSGSSKGRDSGRRAATEATGKPQEQRQLLEQVLRDTYASLLQQI